MTDGGRRAGAGPSGDRDRLVGFWSSDDLVQGMPEVDRLGLRSDGTGWYEWISMGDGWNYRTFTWAVREPGRLTLTDIRGHSGTWSIDPVSDAIGHHVHSRDFEEGSAVVPFAVGPGPTLYKGAVTILDLLEPVFLDNRFALVRRDIESGDEPTIDSVDTSWDA